MNVYQEVVKELKSVSASREAVYYCSQIAFELQDLYSTGMSIKDLAKYCIKNYIKEA